MVEPTALDYGKAVRQWVSLGSGLDYDREVISSRTKDTPEPGGLYATVFRVRDTPEGKNFNSYTVDNRTITHQSITTEWSIQWFNKGASDAARTFQVWAMSPAGSDAAAVRGLTLYSVSDAERLDRIDDTTYWEERVGIDVYIGIVLKFTSPSVPVINSVEVEPTLEN